MYLIYIISENVYSDVNEKRNLDICISLSSNFQIVNQFFLTKVSAFLPIVHIGQSVYNIFSCITYDSFNNVFMQTKDMMFFLIN